MKTADAKSLERTRMLRNPLFWAGLILALFVGAGSGQGLLGHPGGESSGHAWVQWWHSTALPAWPTGTDMALGSLDWKVIDPLPTFFAATLGRLFGVVVGFNAWVILCFATAFWGGAYAAKSVGGDPWTGGMALAFAPAFVGSMSSGLTEDGAVGLVAVAFALLGHQTARDQWGLVVGLCFGCLAWCGMVLAWFSGLAALLVGIGILIWRRTPTQPRPWKPLMGGAGLAVLLASPLAVWHHARLSGEGHRLGSMMERVEPLWRVNPWGGVDMASFWVPGRVDLGDALVRTHPGYLGLSVCCLALMGCRKTPLRWLILVIVGCLLAPGRTLDWMGNPVGMENPFAVLSGFLPFGELLNHFGRAMLVGAVGLAVLAARGARRLGRYAPLAALVVGVDLAFLGPVPVPLEVTEVRAPDLTVPCKRRTPSAEECRDLSSLSPGPMLVIPAAGPGVHPQRSLLHQTVHERPILLAPNRPGLPETLGNQQTVRWLARLAFSDGAPPPKSFELADEVAVLLVLEPYVDILEAVIGVPDLRGKDGAAWDLSPERARSR